MTTAILGLGTALPIRRVPQEQAAVTARAACCDGSEQVRFLDGVYRKSGVASRGSVLLSDADGGGVTQTFYPPRSCAQDPGPGTAHRMRRYMLEAPPLAMAAAREALEAAQLPSRCITHLVTVSCTGFGAPGIDVALIRGLELVPTVRRTHIGFMGCHGAINGLEVARAACSDPAARVLLCAVELCSLHLQYGFDPGQVVANALFADGAAAAVLSGGMGPRTGGGMGLRIRRPVHDADKSGGMGPCTHGPVLAGSGAPPRSATPLGVGDRERLCLVATGSCLFPHSEDAMTWHIGDHGFVMTLSPTVPDLIAQHLRAWICDWLAAHGLSLEQVGSWAVHPGGPRILSGVQDALDLDPSALAVSRAILESCGNMSSPTLLLILSRLIREGAPRPYVALGFGPGLVAEAAIFD